jgi:hypothetical protein
MSMYLRIGLVVRKDLQNVRYPPLAQATIPSQGEKDYVLRDCESGFKIFFAQNFSRFLHYRPV